MDFGDILKKGAVVAASLAATTFAGPFAGAAVAAIGTKLVGGDMKEAEMAGIAGGIGGAVLKGPMQAGLGHLTGAHDGPGH